MDVTRELGFTRISSPLLIISVGIHYTHVKSLYVVTAWAFSIVIDNQLLHRMQCSKMQLQDYILGNTYSRNGGFFLAFENLEDCSIIPLLRFFLFS